MRTLVVAALLTGVAPVAPAALAQGEGNADPASLDLRIVEQDGRYRVEALSDGEPALRSPEEGLWSIACEWRDDWPADWHHAHPNRAKRVGPWTILHGELDVPVWTQQ